MLLQVCDVFGQRNQASQYFTSQRYLFDGALVILQGLARLCYPEYSVL